ncbi:hypothetical protein [Nocardioides sp.]|uniref:hypothetical protein n=1 Tax=Nocardioides sp. TaxID=35761 RepID=UPI0039E597AE
MSHNDFARRASVVAAAAVALLVAAGAGWTIVGGAQAADAPADTSATSASDSSTSSGPASCAGETVPHLDIEAFPDADTVGAKSVTAAVAAVTTRSVAETATMTPFGSADDAPVWVTTVDASYIVTPTPDGGWFAAPARLLGCDSLDELGSKVPVSR